MACFICGEVELTNLCEVCGQVHVCINHGTLHSSSTKNCFPFKIAQHKYKGRILVATRNVEAGEVLFEEKPLFCGPAKSSKPICLTCLGRSVPKERCPGCNFPMCSSKCAEEHVKMPECAIIGRNLPITSSTKKPASVVAAGGEEPVVVDLQAILPLRCLLAKDNHNWQYLQMFEDHCKDRKLTPAWQSDSKGIVGQIRDKWGQSQFSEEEIRRVDGILDVNTLELLDFEKEEEVTTPRAFYPITSFASHDCVNNTFRTLNGPVLQTRAKTNIKMGEEITLHYAGGLKGRLMRRSLLAEGWFFACQCKRCKSPDELGSHMSTLKCCKCQQGWLMHDCDIYNEEQAAYHCNFCSHQLKASEVAEIEREFSEAIEENYNDDGYKLKEVLDAHKDMFHPRHFLILILKWLLLNIYGRQKEFQYPLLTPDLVQDKLTYCQDYLEAMDIIDPGLSHNRGITLWELYSVKAFMLSKNWQSGKLSKEDFKNEIKDLIAILEEVKSCLKYNPETSFEFNVMKMAEKALVNSKETLTFIDLM